MKKEEKEERGSTDLEEKRKGMKWLLVE